jgi:hypothetical protein
MGRQRSEEEVARIQAQVNWVVNTIPQPTIRLVVNNKEKRTAVGREIIKFCADALYDHLCDMCNDPQP